MTASFESSVIEIESPEILGLQNFETFSSMPDDIGFFDRDTTSTTIMVAGKIHEIILEDPRFKIFASNGKTTFNLFSETTLRPKDETSIIGRVLTDLHWDERANDLATALLERYPNVHWLRGGSLDTNGQGVLTLDEATQAEGGSNGYLGNPYGALSYAHSNYLAIGRPDAVLYAAPFKQVVQGVSDDIIRLGSPHGYDLTIIQQGNNDQFAQWCKESVAAFIVGENSFAQEKELVVSKCIN